MLLAWPLLIMVALAALIPRLYSLPFANRTESVYLPSFLQALSSVRPLAYKPDQTGGKLVVFPKEVLQQASLEMLLNNETNQPLVRIDIDFLHNSDNGSFGGNGIVLPTETSLMLIFNTTGNNRVPSLDDPRFSDFIKGSPPFLLPAMLNLVDYFLVAPNSYISASNGNTYLKGLRDSYSEHVSEAPPRVFPMFRKCIREQFPMLTLVFNEGNSSSFESAVNPIMSTKSISSQGSTTISWVFDMLAQTWLTYLNVDSLMRSVSCSINLVDSSNSYCAEVQDDSFGGLFSVFDDFFFPPIGPSRVIPLPGGAVILPPSGNPYVGLPTGDPKWTFVPDPRNPGRLIYVPYMPSESLDGIRDSSITSSAPLKYFVGEMNTSHVSEQHYDGISFPLTLLDLDTEPASPRSRNFSQVIFSAYLNYSSGTSLPSQTVSDESCLDVTWYGIFHHFGVNAKTCDMNHPRRSTTSLYS